MLTKKQQTILDFIQSYVESNGYAPTIREIASSFSISTTTAFEHLKRLEKKGALKRPAKVSRATVIPHPKTIKTELLPVSKIPILGEIPAGPFRIPVHNEEGCIEIPSSMIKGNTVFALKVQGDSMENAGINNGDYAIVQQRNYAENKDIVAILVDGEVTLKYLRRKKGISFLESANPKYPAIKLSRHQNITILGRLIASLKFH